MLIFQPTALFLYPYVASWLARSPQLAQHDFSFIKQVIVGGAVIDPTTIDLLKRNLPSAFVTLV